MKGTTSYLIKPRPTVCIIGAGFSGILAAIKLKTKLGMTDFIIFDENEDFGGVWLVNTYPGAGCDSPSHLYSYSFELNPYWSRNFSCQEEILDYLKGVAEKHGLHENARFYSQVKELQWVEELGQWKVQVYNKAEGTTIDYFFSIVINSPGALRVPNIPENFESFKGPIFHSARWDASIDLEDKVVAVIGSGASAIQIIPKIAPKVKELHCYQRQPGWIFPKINWKFPTFIKWIFAYFPFIMRLFRWSLFWMMEIFYSTLVIGTLARKIARLYGVHYMKKQLNGDKDLVEKLIPKYEFGCKRVLISNKYLDTFLRPNVKLHVDPITIVDSDSITTQTGKRQQIDVLILATGFRVQEYFAPMSIVGKNGQNILDHWLKERPEGYLGIVSTSTPNQFGLIGPHTGLGHNSVIFMAECQMNYIVQLIAEMVRRNSKVLELKKSTEETDMTRLDKRMKKMVWGNATCGSWYANSDGLNTTLWPWTCIKYWRRTRTPKWSKFHFRENLEAVIVLTDK